MSGPENFNEIIACQDCGHLTRLSALPDKTIAKCFRCDARLCHEARDTTDRTLALALTSLILFAIANLYPFLSMSIEGFVQQTNLITGIFTLYHQGMIGLASIVFLTVAILPLIQILGIIYIYLPIKLGIIPWKTASTFRAIQHLQPWGMMEVYMLGILISMVKLAKMATIIPGIASGAFMILICVLAATLSGLNPDDVWKRMTIKINSTPEGRDKEVFLIGCRSCALVCRTPGLRSHYTCPRCKAPLHFRKTGSIQRTWALIIAAFILYVPANIFPVTMTSTLGHEQADTIFSGVIYFIVSGSWHIAIVIFVASVIVPLVKLFVLLYLLISVQKKSSWKPEDRTRLYRMTEVVGRWSMVDVYVVTILVSLVQLGPIATITAGPGAAYFSAVVILTMLAAESFDPRLIWDALEENNEYT